MPRLQSRCQQPERWDHRKINIVAHRHKVRGPLRVDFGDSWVIAWIDRHYIRVFVNNLRLVISHSVDLVRDLVEVRPPDDYPNQFCSAEFYSWAGIIRLRRGYGGRADPGYRNRLRPSSLIRKRIKGWLAVGRWTLSVGR